MKRTILFLLLIPGLLGLQSCEKIKGTGEMEDELRTVGAFDGISVSMDCIIDLQEPDSAMKANNLDYQVKVHAQGNMMRYIEANTQGGILWITFSEKKIPAGHEPITITVMAPGCSHISINTPGTVTLQMAVSKVVNDTIVGDSVIRPFLECQNDGPGSIILKQVGYTYGEFRNRGSGSIFSTDSGMVAEMRIWNTGSGRVDLLKTSSETVWVENSGSGPVSVSVSRYLNNILTGSGNTYYKSDSAKVENTDTGPGMLIRL